MKVNSATKGTHFTTVGCYKTMYGAGVHRYRTNEHGSKVNNSLSVQSIVAIICTFGVGFFFQILAIFKM
jgi:hypothetical protein